MNVLELSEQEIIRRNSMNELRAMGIEPYPAAEYVTNAFSTDIKKEFKDDAEPRHVSVAGRIMSRAQAFKSISMEEYRQSMQGIYSESLNEETKDESPMVYKPKDEIIQNIRQTVSIENIIKPVFNFKAAE